MALLGAALLSPTEAGRAFGLVVPGDFLDNRHGQIWAAIKRLAESGADVDVLTIQHRMVADQTARADTPQYLVELLEATPTAAHVVTYARAVRAGAVRREVVKIASEVVRDGTQGAGIHDAAAWVGGIEQRIYDAASRARSGMDAESGPQPMRSAMHAVLKDVEAVYERAQARSMGADAIVDNKSGTPAPSGFLELDRLLGGFRPQCLYLLAGRPGRGKTSLGLQMAVHAAKCGFPGAFFSLEMSTLELGWRALCGEARVGSQRIRDGTCNPGHWTRITAAASRLNSIPLEIDDTGGLLIATLAQRARQLVSSRGARIIWVDYVQLLRASEGKAAAYRSQEQETSLVSAGLKLLSKDLQVPVVALAQMNRSIEGREDQRPRLSDLRSSGALEQDADAVLFISHESGGEQASEATRLPTTLEVAKHRHGPTGPVNLTFLPAFTCFEGAEVEGL